MKKKLSNVTLLGIDCVDIDRLIRARDICTGYMEFAEVKLLTSLPTDDKDAIHIEPLLSREAYSEFMIKRLNDYVDTEFVLVIQYDGFILNPNAWSDDYLKYDYIGAPWWYPEGERNVGNGGFSLRSKKLLEILATNPNINDFHPEDDRICRFYGPYLEEKGIVFAPNDLARLFSVETFKTPRPGAPNKWKGQFGFHGYYTDIELWLRDHEEERIPLTDAFEKRKIARKKEKFQEMYIIRDTPEGKTFTKKAKEGELLMYKEVLSVIAPQYNPQFSLLELPIALATNETSFEPTLTIPFYEGETFGDRWDESNGGQPLGLDLSAEFPELIRELSTVAIESILLNSKLVQIPKFTFDQEEYLPEFEAIVSLFVEKGVLTLSEVSQAREILKVRYLSPRILNNGDFYPRNLIRMSSGKIVLIDWETWNANSRANVVDHIENVAAFCFVHMWGNPEWQKKYVYELQNRLPITLADFQKGILIKSLEMANFWFKENGANNLCRNQIRIFSNALNPQYMKELWGGSNDLYIQF